MAFQLFNFIASISFLYLFTTGTAQTQTTDLVAPARYEPQEYYRICPLPRCETCPSVERLQAPGIGFALETSHGTAVVRLHDGTLHDIALIQGDASYTTLMRRLATGPMTRTPDDSDSHWKMLQYLESRAQRLRNKLVGRTATPETAILASMVSKLLEATQTWLGDEQAIVAAVLGSPDRISLTDEEIGDIFDYLKLKMHVSNVFRVDSGSHLRATLTMIVLHNMTTSHESRQWMRKLTDRVFAYTSWVFRPFTFIAEWLFRLSPHRVQDLTYFGKGKIVKLPRVLVDEPELTEENMRAMSNEANAYRLMGRHPRIAACLLAVPDEGRVELEYYPQGTLKRLVDDWPLDMTAKLRFARQMIESLDVVHSHAIRHSDLRLDQWLLDQQGNARLSDFNAAGLDTNIALGINGSPALGLERASHFMPREDPGDSTVTSDLFALGSSLYELETTHSPFEGEDDDEILNRYKDQDFPDTTELLLAPVIRKCWHRELSTAMEALDYVLRQASVSLTVRA